MNRISSTEQGFMHGDPIGANVDDCVESDDFNELMKRINQLEEQLILREQTHSEEFHRWMEGWCKSID